jgi:antitoxin VapB
MPFHVRDPETDALVRAYAQDQRVGITDAIKLAVTRARQADEEALSDKRKALKAIRDELNSYPRTGEKADKAFFDELSGD